MEDIHSKKIATHPDLVFTYMFVGILVILGGIIGYIIGFKTASASVVNPTVATISVVESTAIEPTAAENPFETSNTSPSEALSAPVTDEKVVEVDTDDLEMLACVIYQEAGGNRSCDNCRRYVADIVLNRVEHPNFPNTMEEVLTAQGQYGLYYWTGIKWLDRAKYDCEKEAVERAYQTAREVLSGQHSELYGQGYIWQAGFVQGVEGFWCCGHWYGR